MIRGIHFALDARAAWRVLLMVAIGQLSGIAIAYGLGIPHSTSVMPAMPPEELQCTIGASFGTMAGFVLGVFWQHSVARSTTPTPFLRLLACLVTILLLPGIVFLATSAHAP